MNRVSKSILFICIFVLTSSIQALAKLDYDRVSEVSLYPTFIKNPTLFGTTNRNAEKNQENYYFFVQTRWSVSSENFSFEIQPEYRSVQSSAALNIGMRNAVKSPNRLMSLKTKLASRSREESLFDIERLNVNYIYKNAQFSLGRKPVGLGVLAVFPVWNKFTRPLMTDYGPLRIFSQDIASARIQKGPWLAQAIDIEMRDSELATRLGELTWFGEGMELHALAGAFGRGNGFGFAAVHDYLGTSVKLEGISFSEDGIQSGLGLERAFDEFWSGLAEFLYLETGAPHKEDYFSLNPSSLRPLNARYYGYFRLEYKPMPLLTLQLGDLANFVDASHMIDAKAIYSAANDLELTLECRIPTGGYDSELSRHYSSTQGLLGIRYDF